MPQAMQATAHLVLMLVAVLAAAAGTTASDLRSSKALDCSQPLQLGEYQYDFSTLSEALNSETISTPPSTTRISLGVNLCAPLSASEPSDEACPSNTRICLKIATTRPGAGESLNQIVPLHTSDLGYEAETSSKGAGDKLEWTFYGPQYGDRKQKVEIEMICDANVKQERPEFRAYDLLEGEAKVYWRSQAACPKKRQSGGGGGSGSGQDSNVGGGQTPASSSGWGFFSWFFFLSTIGLIAYFVIGTYLNQQRYGTYEIPNRDFWREAPYLVRDAGTHAWKSISGQGNSGRGAYEPL